MNAKLLTVAGPASVGTVLELRDAAISIGRDRINQICIEDRAVSRQHCALTLEKGRWTITDLGSQNHTYVNGLPIEERFLAPGDEIKVGSSSFLFLVEAEVVAQEPGLELDEDTVITGSTVLLRREDAVYLNPRTAATAWPTLSTRVASDLKLLLAVGEAVSSISGLQSLQNRLMGLIFEGVPAEYGFMLLTEKGALNGESGFQAVRYPGSQRAMLVSRTIVDRVLAEQVSLCANNVLAGKGMALSESIVHSQLNSVLAVPLVAFGKVIGAIYLGSSASSVRFDEAHLQLVTGIAGISGGALANAVRVEKLENHNRQLQAAITAEHNMVGESTRMGEVYRFISKVAPTESTVLIGGESGTGKELVAHGIHRNSPRSSRPFVAVNCPTLSETLLESELFGHEKGAFTGAFARKQGKFEEAAGGSVFLDEIGELAPGLQTKLLRVLQEREFDRVGGTRPVKADIRIIAATNRNLKAEVERGAFRHDLYFRLNVVSIIMPPLREHPEDIPALADYFIERHGKRAKRTVIGCSDKALAYMKMYDWPGNVRELENAIERALVMGSAEVILPEDLPESVLVSEPPGDSAGLQFHKTIRQLKRQMVGKALEQAHGSYTEAAKLLGLHPNNLHRLTKSLQLKIAGQ